MIGLSLITRTKQKDKTILVKKFTKLYKNVDQARPYINEVVAEMKKAELEKRDPQAEITGVSYETDSERLALVELGAIKTES